MTGSAAIPARVAPLRPVGPPPRQPIAGPPPVPRGKLVGLGLAGSVAVHLAVLALVFWAVKRPADRALQTPVEIDVVEQARPPPPPPSEEKKPEPVEPRPKPVVVVKRAPPPPEQKKLEPPPPNEPPPPEAKEDAPVLVGISLSSTSAAGGFAAPVGNTLYGEAPRVAPKPEEVKPYASATGRYVPPYKVTQIPELLSEVKAAYPEEARREGLEGQVVLKLVVGADGKVARATLVRRAEHGFDQAALDAVRKFRFKPGMEGGEPVATEITYTYTFILD